MLNQQIKQQIKDMLREEIATELGIELGADTTARNNGAVGGHVTNRLIEFGYMKVYENLQEQSVINNQITTQTTNDQLNLH